MNQRQTNLEKIKSLSAEQLAEMLVIDKDEFNTDMIGYYTWSDFEGNEQGRYLSFNDAVESCIEWLNEETEE